jgi:hypothetical protein
MPIGAFLVTAFIETLSPEPLACTFPAPEPDRPPISLSVEARPSLMDRIDRFRVRVLLPKSGEIVGHARPIDRTADRDVLIRTRTAGKAFLTIGLRDDGSAALDFLRVTSSDGFERVETREGACRDYHDVLDRWLG